MEHQFVVRRADDPHAIRARVHVASRGSGQPDSSRQALRSNVLMPVREDAGFWCGAEEKRRTAGFREAGCCRSVHLAVLRG
jgi:hypothetical protein